MTQMKYYIYIIPDDVYFVNTNFSLLFVKICATIILWFCHKR